MTVAKQGRKKMKHVREGKLRDGKRKRMLRKDEEEWVQGQDEGGRQGSVCGGAK